MADADLAALRIAGGSTAPIRIIPTAAAPDNNEIRAGANGVAWFKGLGAADVRTIPVIDRASADQPELAKELESARFIFMLGGFTHYLAETLTGSRAWKAMQTAFHSGAVIGGSSAGAMVLCEHYFDQTSGQVMPGFNLLPGGCVLPHHNTFGKQWAHPIGRLLPGVHLLGIDEETGLLNDGPAGEWTVYGKGAVTIYGPNRQSVYCHGQRFALPMTLGGLL
jgi:cyanophycinase